MVNNTVDSLKTNRMMVKSIKEEINTFYEENKKELDPQILEYNRLKSLDNVNYIDLEKYLRKNILLLKYNYLFSYLKYYEGEVRNYKKSIQQKIKKHK